MASSAGEKGIIFGETKISCSGYCGKCVWNGMKSEIENKVS